MDLKRVEDAVERRRHGQLQRGQFLEQARVLRVVGGHGFGQLIRLVVLARGLQGRDFAKSLHNFLLVRGLVLGQLVAQRGGVRLEAPRVFIVEDGGGRIEAVFFHQLIEAIFFALQPVGLAGGQLLFLALGVNAQILRQMIELLLGQLEFADLHVTMLRRLEILDEPGSTGGILREAVGNRLVQADRRQRVRPGQVQRVFFHQIGHQR